MSRRTQEAIEALIGTYPKTEALKKKQRNLLKILKSAAESGQTIESRADCEASKLEPSTGIASKIASSRII